MSKRHLASCSALMDMLITFLNFDNLLNIYSELKLNSFLKNHPESWFDFVVTDWILLAQCK